MHVGLQPVPFAWTASCLAAACALYCLYRALASVRRDRVVADTPLVKIRSAAQGYVKIAGRAAPGPDGELTAPLSNRPCIWWRYEIDRRVRNAKGQSSWERVDHGASVGLFALCDADGQCLVGPLRAEITPTTRNVWYGTTPQPHGFASSALSTFGQGDFRYTESLLGTGDRLSVLGEFRAHSDTGNNGAGAAALLKQWKEDQDGLLARFDSNHDGHIDAGEWEAARQEALRESQSQTLAAPVTRLCVVSEPAQGQPFMIAALDGAHLVRRERLHAFLFFALGLICIVACAWAIDCARHPGELSAHASNMRSGPSLLPLLIALVPGLVALGHWVARRQES